MPVPCTCAVLVVAMAAAARATLAPKVYWVTNPILPGETVMVAGAGFAAAAEASFCGASSSSPRAATLCHPSPSSSWESSVKAVLPAGCGPPCTLQIATGSHSGPEAVRVPLNLPDLWWAGSAHPADAAAAPAPPHSSSAAATTAVEAAVPIGGRLRVFGRGLGWTTTEDVGGSLRCLNSSLPPAASSATILELAPAEAVAAAAAPAISLHSVAASCYEAAFDLPAEQAVPPGLYSGRVRTAWGLSEQRITLAVTRPQRRPGPVVLDVDAQYGGSVAAGLAAAAALVRNATGSMTPRVVVQLGPRVYPATTQLTVPSRTEIRGCGANASTISAVLHTAPAVGGSCGAPIVGVDFADPACNATRVWGEHCFRATEELPARTIGECCDACKRSLVPPGCNAYTFDRRRQVCSLKYCDDGSTCWRTTNASVSSGWLNGGCSGQPATACAGPVGGAVLLVGSGVTLTNFGLTIEPATTIPALVAVWMPKGTRSFQATGHVILGALCCTTGGDQSTLCACAPGKLGRTA